MTDAEEKEIIQVKVSVLQGFLEVVQKKKKTLIKIAEIVKIEEWTDPDYFKSEVTTIIYTTDGKESRFEAPLEDFLDSIKTATQ